jgi:putative SOS response-associated peptidase YedK
MCNLYQITSSLEAMRLLFRAMAGTPDPIPSLAHFYPGRPAPVVMETPAGWALATMRWGVPGPRAAAGKPVTNIRNLDSPFWRPLLGRASRALVPVSAFSEWSAEPDPQTGRKRQHWFALRDQPLFAFAGAWRPSADGQRPAFAFLTTSPNAMVGRVHPRAMPVILTGEDAEDWLAGAPAEVFQRPFPDAAMQALESGPT